LFGTTADARGQPITTPADLLLIVPEPALAGLGIAALEIVRRKARS